MSRPQAATLPTKLDNRIDRTDTCWLWIGSTTTAGYGNVKWGGANAYVHRLVYELLVGPIPKGLTIDHLCYVRECCNPGHLEPVTQAENTRRAQARKTHCPHGHEYTEGNTYRSPKGERRCRTCAKAQQAIVLARLRAATAQRRAAA